LPGVATFFGWLLVGVAKGRQFGAPGEPWKASAPLFDRQNFIFQPVSEKLARLPDLLAGGFWNYADRPALWALSVAALVVLVLGLVFRQPVARGFVARLRPVLLFLLAALCYVALPQDITGYMYAICPRYAQVAALLLITVLPFPFGRSYQVFVAVAVAAVAFAGINLTVLFREFDVEADNFEMLVKDLPKSARVMHLIVNWGSRLATHPVYLHYAALAAERVDGVPSFSLATDPSFPVGYKPGAQPPASPWEWRPLEVSWEQMKWYDVYLSRGEVPPEQLFRGHAQEVELAARADLWRLYKKKTHAGAEHALQQPARPQ
jgi:hypothetical protein